MIRSFIRVYFEPLDIPLPAEDQPDAEVVFESADSIEDYVRENWEHLVDPSDPQIGAMKLVSRDTMDKPSAQPVAQRSGFDQGVDEALRARITGVVERAEKFELRRIADMLGVPMDYPLIDRD